jgi:hypothetical protein
MSNSFGVWFSGRLSPPEAKYRNGQTRYSCKDVPKLGHFVTDRLLNDEDNLEFTGG